MMEARAVSDQTETRRLDDLTIDGDIFKVLVNDEGQYSLWPGAQPAPDGWMEACPPAPKAEALAYVEAHWTDMRPASLREAMARDAAERSTVQPARVDDT
jgi:MbtH protein